ncbi:MAG: nucleotide exchange factor GrpE [Lentisphaerae bacterium]|nr:nucleotide exchange factor GrpE [Lentisphaerota bacterium]
MPVTDKPEEHATPAAEPSAGGASAPAAPAHESRHRGRRARADKAREEEIKALQDRLLRLQADFDNFRKRTLREKEDLYCRANEDLMMELLPVLDHLDLALAAAQARDNADPVAEGFRMVAEQLLSKLGKFGLTPVDAQGVPFDPNLHEAISHLPSADAPESSIIAQVRRGYRLGAQLLRPAQVVVSSGPPAPSPEAGEEA